MKKIIIKAFTFIGGLYFFLYFLIPNEVAKNYQINGLSLEEIHGTISKGFIAISALTFGLGLWNIIIHHLGTVVRKKENSFFSIVLLVGLFLSMFVSAFDWRESIKAESRLQNFEMLLAFNKKIGEDSTKQMLLYNSYQEAAFKEIDNLYRDPKTEQQDQLIEILEKSPFDAKIIEESLLPKLRAHTLTLQENSLASKIYKVLFEGLYTSLGSSMFSLLGVFIAIAAFRAFKIRSIEGTLMMTAATFVMLGQVSFGQYIWSGFPAVRQWLMEVPVSASFRAIFMGSAVAGFILLFRIWLSIEEEEAK